VDRGVRRARYGGAVLLNSHQSEPVLAEAPTSPHVFVAASDAARAALHAVTEAPVRVVHNGVDFEFWSEGEGPVRPEPRPLLVWAGRSTDIVAKSPEGFLALAAKHGEGYRYVLADADAHIPTLDFPTWAPSLVRRVGLDRTQLRNVYRDAAASGGALISTSRAEAFQLVVAEALAAGCPVVVPRLPGLQWLWSEIPDLAYDRSSGTAGIDRVLERLDVSSFRLEAIDRGRRLVAERYAAEGMVAGYEAAYLDALRIAADRLRLNSTLDHAARFAWQRAFAARRMARSIRD
jgi:glycosyltransferase involved in cell wall biosynthesis